MASLFKMNFVLLFLSGWYDVLARDWIFKVQFYSCGLPFLLFSP